MRDLIVRAQHGDRQAFGVVAHAASHRLFAVATRILRDRGRAEDCVQEALVVIWRDFRALRDPDRFDAWAVRILVRICHREARRARAGGTFVTDMTDRAAAGDAFAEIADREAIERAFAFLTVDQRTVIVLRHYLELDATEIAEAIGVPPGTVRSRLHYALRALRAAMEADARSTREAAS